MLSFAKMTSDLESRDYPKARNIVTGGNLNSPQEFWRRTAVRISEFFGDHRPYKFARSEPLKSLG